MCSDVDARLTGHPKVTLCTEVWTNQTTKGGGGDLENMQATFWDTNCAIARQIAHS